MYGAEGILGEKYWRGRPGPQWAVLQAVIKSLASNAMEKHEGLLNREVTKSNLHFKKVTQAARLEEGKEGNQGGSQPGEMTEAYKTPV